ncbi:MAG: hypothetical protein HY331_02670 [Chloroflexi bacterium]|nr:hypothetical protein [Chloroflexota bacterium]
MRSGKHRLCILIMAQVVLALVLHPSVEQRAEGFGPGEDYKKWIPGNNIIYRFGANRDRFGGLDWRDFVDGDFPYNARQAVVEAAEGDDDVRGPGWSVHAGPGVARLRFSQGVPADSRTGVYSINDPAAAWAGGWFESFGTGQMVYAQHFLNAADPAVRDPNGYGLAVKLMKHEFGHWLYLADTNGRPRADPPEGSPCAQEQRVTLPIMRDAVNGSIDWDEQFGAQLLCGPYYMGFERMDAYQNLRLYQTGGVWGDRAVILDVPDGRGPDWIWDNWCPPANANGYKAYIIEGNLDGANEHRYIYYKVSDNGWPGLPLRNGMVLAWHQSNQESYFMSVDAKLFKPSTGETRHLRDFNLRDQYGDIVHPAARQNRAGGWGNWVWYSVDLNQDWGFGNPIDGWHLQEVIVAYDRGHTETRFRAYFDNINIYCKEGWVCPQ